MKIIILHGEDSQKSYQRLLKFIDEAKERGWDIVRDELPTTSSLFGTKSLIIFRKYQLITKKMLELIQKMDGALVVYHEDILPQAFIKQIEKNNQVKIEKFELPKLLWRFLDSINIKMFHEVIKKEPVEFVFALIAKRMRDLFWIKTNPKSFPKSSWQAKIIASQANKFREDKLKEIIEELAVMDIKAKTSKANLIDSLDLLMLKHLQ